MPFALKKKLKNRPEFDKCLSCLAVDGQESSYLEYTKEWTKAVNRGGLFEVNDKAYNFFYDLEMKVRKHLPRLFRSSVPSSIKGDIIKDLMSDDNILFSWTILTIDDEELLQELLQHMIDMWLTIRGFSATGAWMEYYKQYKDSTTKGKHAFRKGLKKKQ